jgi:hypothetical protein
LAGGVFAADGHQAGHFVLGDVDGLAAVFGQAEVLDFEVAGRCRFWRFCEARADLAGLIRGGMG